MKSSNYCCVNCELDFAVEEAYIGHYRSEHHRYNIKRKLIGLAPLSLPDYQMQFQDDKTSRQSTQQELHCEICCKKFFSPGTYQAHLKSKKHKINRNKIKAPDTLSVGKSESSSDFSVIGAEKIDTCLFCHEPATKEHLKIQHSFPPFEADCSDVKGLTAYVREELKEGTCIFCKNSYETQEAVKQHMQDVGHCKLDFDNFAEFQKFYMWKIEESSSSEEQDLTMEPEGEGEQHEVYEQLNKPTLEDIQNRRLGRIKYTTTGAIINGREVGYRYLKNYYKQYLGREMENTRAKYQPAIEADQDWKNGYSKMALAPPKITLNNTHR